MEFKIGQKVKYKKRIGKITRILPESGHACVMFDNKIIKICAITLLEPYEPETV